MLGLSRLYTGERKPIPQPGNFFNQISDGMDDPCGMPRTLVLEHSFALFMETGHKFPERR